MTLLTAFVESAIRALLLAGVVGAALTIFRVRSTAWRLSAWTIVLGAALAMPALGRVLPTWRVPVAEVPALAWLQPAGPTARPGASRLTSVRPSRPPAARVAASAPRTPIAASTTSEAADSTSSRTPIEAPRSSRAIVLVAGIYLAGLLTLSLRVIMGWIATRRLQRAALPIDDAEAVARLARISRSAGCSRAPRFAESDRLHVPVTVSIARPTVILPGTWRAWDAAMLDAVLTHEVAHVARRDALTQRAGLLYRAIFWFSPLAWWLPRHLMDLAEQASDEAVLSAGTSRTCYARVLLEFFGAVPQPGYRADWHVAMARGVTASAEARVDRILAWKGGQVMRLTTTVAMSVLLAAAPAVALSASVRPMPVALDWTAVLPVQLDLSPSSLVPAPAPPTAIAPPPAIASSPAIAPPPEVAPVAAPIQTQAPLPAPGIYRPGNGVSWPKVITEFKPVYTSQAVDAKIQGSVELEVAVLPDGTVGPVRVTKSLDATYGLDNEAVRAARQWIFQPAEFNGQPVAALVGLVLEFRLTDPPTTPSTVARPRPLGDAFANGAYFAIDERGAQQVGLIVPKPIVQPSPKYTADGMRAKIQGEVEVEAIVMPDGTVGKVRVVRLLDAALGLDEAALTAAKQSTFTPGTLDGKPVPVLVTMTFTFRLH